MLEHELIDPDKKPFKLMAFLKHWENLANHAAYEKIDEIDFFLKRKGNSKAIARAQKEKEEILSKLITLKPFINQAHPPIDPMKIKNLKIPCLSSEKLNTLKSLLSDNTVSIYEAAYKVGIPGYRLSCALTGRRFTPTKEEREAGIF